METGILAAVGVNKTNNDIDVEVVQRLLNRVPTRLGGPPPRLAEDGDCGPLTIAAIRKFQQAALGFNDGSVEPFKNTHRKLIDLAGDAEDIPMRIDLAERIRPFIMPMIFSASAALNVLRQNPSASGTGVDRTREAFKVHFLLSEPDEGQAGRVMRRFDDIRVLIDSRELLWRDATIKRGKIETNQPKTVRLPAIYVNFTTRAQIVFTPNYKPFDAQDSLGFGPQSLGHALIVGNAKHAVGHELGKPVLQADTPGYPGRTFDEALTNPAAYGGFAFQLRMGIAVPFGDSNRQI